MFVSPTYGKMGFNELCVRLKDYFDKMKSTESPIQLIIGTDSQNFSDTKIVRVICMLCEGHGGIFFYEITRQMRINDVRTKLHVETNDSLGLATRLVDNLEENEAFHEMYLSCPISIHIDAGNSEKGKTKDLIPELVGWVKSMGYDCETKPDSFVASTIADRISK